MMSGLPTIGHVFTMLLGLSNTASYGFQNFIRMSRWEKGNGFSEPAHKRIKQLYHDVVQSNSPNWTGNLHFSSFTF